MKGTKIQVVFDSNELTHSSGRTGDRTDRIAAMALAIANRADNLFEGPFKRTTEQIVDLMFACERLRVYCELKKVKDLIDSWKDERLSAQIMAMASTGAPSFLLVLGSDADVLAAWPKTGRRGERLSQDDRVRGWKSLMSYLNEIEADTGVLIKFRAIDPMGQCLSIAKHMMFPQDIPNIPKKSFKRMAGLAYPAYMLSRGPGISTNTAANLIKEFGSIHELNRIAEKDITRITSHEIKGRKIGKRAEATFRIMGSLP